ncbi:S1/P1 nuclease [Pontibacter sp. SGAir0037]|uniref:S1/P1 nuclease n=1 Tax=Pontibacter sp. SGAir0037 TaxID=2571030 RepID=UPI0010CD10BD|nr:S1/P1 nuclease [Pontibacter sp. SGAir0037]QCR25057.1 S1/P1 Nuclease [Pontibacter sp. SGAir0037]
MANNILKKILLVGLFLYLPLQTMAWGMLGHRIVGEIADLHLSRKARKQVQQILGTESVAIASNWADFIKSDPAYNYLNTWHYINFEEGMSHEAIDAYLAQDTVTDAYTKLNFMIQELKNKQLPLEQKQMYLRLVIHIVGDMHQPMHAGRPGDLGGNRIRVSWFNQPSNLHRVWDEQLIEYQQLSYTEYVKAINHTTKKQTQEWQKQPINQWLFESYVLADQLYKEIEQPEQKLSYAYNFRHVYSLNEQLLKGGVRLAGVLNEIFG